MAELGCYDFDEWDEQKSALLLPRLRRMIGNVRKQKILDVGCGSGIVSGWLAEQNQVFGLEQNDRAVKKARTRGIHCKKADLERAFPFQDSRFDGAICKDVFEHLIEPEKTLKEIRRVLKRNGWLLAHVPNQFTLLDRARILFGGNMVVERWFAGTSEWSFPHLRFFTRNGFRRFLEQNGFEIVREHSGDWSYHIPGTSVELGALSRIAPQWFSPGITYYCKKN